MHRACVGARCVPPLEVRALPHARPVAPREGMAGGGGGRKRSSRMMWACGEGKAAPRRADGVGLVRVRVRWSAHGSPSRSGATQRCILRTGGARLPGAPHPVVVSTAWYVAWPPALCHPWSRVFLLGAAAVGSAAVDVVFPANSHQFHEPKSFHRPVHHLLRSRHGVNNHRSAIVRGEKQRDGVGGLLWGSRTL